MPIGQQTVTNAEYHWKLTSVYHVFYVSIAVSGFFATGQFAVKKMLASVRLGQIRLGQGFFTANCPTAKNLIAIKSSLTVTQHPHNQLELGS